MGSEIVKTVRWRERIFKKMDKRSSRLEKISQHWKKKSRKWMGKDKEKGNKYLKWRIANEGRIPAREEWNIKAIKAIRVIQVENRKVRNWNWIRIKVKHWE